MPEPAASAPWWRQHWPAIALVVLAGAVAVWAHHALFPAYSWNRDEPVYLWHVDVLRSGQLTATDGGHPSLFQPWLSARGDGVLFTQYTLGWPLVLAAADLLTGSAATALPLGAALAVCGTYVVGLELLRDHRIATLGAALMVASPILAIQGGVYLSYLFTLGLGLLAGALLLSGQRLHRPARLVAAGLLFGWIFLTRPYDALLWGLAFAGCLALRHRDRLAAVVRPLLLCAVSAVPLVVLTLAYNRHVTGGWTEFPITAADPLDTFGFGARRLMPTFEVVDYDVPTALRATAKNAFLLPWFLAGSYAGIGVAAVGAWQRRREPSTLALLLVGAVFPLGYVVFWGNHLSSMAARISGPIYFIPLYAPICLLMATVLVDWWPDRRRAARTLAAVLVVATVPLAVSRFAVNRDISVAQRPWRTSVADLDGRALVVVADTAPYLLYLNPFSSNGPQLDDRVLYAADSGPEVLDLIAELPDRTPYLQQGSVAAPDVGPREDPAPLDVSLRPIVVHRGAALGLTLVVARPDPGSHVHVAITTGAAEHRFDLAPDGSAAPERVEAEVSPTGGDGRLALAPRGQVSVTVGYGSDAAAARRSPQVRTDVVYRVVEGEVEALVPVADHRLVLVDGEPQWRRTLDQPELQLEVTPRAPR